MANYALHEAHVKYEMKMENHATYISNDLSADVSLVCL